MSLEEEDLKGEIRYYGESKLIFSKGKYFNFHTPLNLSRLLELHDGDFVKIFVNMPRMIIMLKVIRGAKKEEKKGRKR